MNVDVSIIIVTYNSAEVITACLDAVKASHSCSFETFVVDNASTDDCATLICHDFPWVRLTENTNNRGFGAASNQVLPFCSGRYVFFLNPDARLASDALKQASAHMDKHPAVGLAGCKVINPDG